MGYYVHLSVVFACDSNEGVAAVAKSHLAFFPPDDDDHYEYFEARLFLEALAKRTGRNPGPKGGISTWGMIINGSREEDFVTVLKPFWADLLGASGFIEGAPRDCEHVIVFYEHEQSERANCYEISWHRDTRELKVKNHEDLPFAWMQM